VIDVIAGRHGIGMAPASVHFPDEQAGMMGVSSGIVYIRTADVAEVVEAAKIVEFAELGLPNLAIYGRGAIGGGRLPALGLSLSEIPSSCAFMIVAEMPRSSSAAICAVGIVLARRRSFSISSSVQRLRPTAVSPIPSFLKAGESKSSFANNPKSPPSYAKTRAGTAGLGLRSKDDRRQSGEVWWPVKELLLK
jgi:hypothetical protein